MKKSDIKTICYFHGLGSSAKSNKVECLKKVFPDAEVLSLDIPVDPIEAFQTVSNFIIENKVDLIVASSLGAFYAQIIYGPAKILVNPSYLPSKEIPALLPFDFEIHYLNERSNGDLTYKITEKDIERFKLLEKQRAIWQSSDFEHRIGTYLLFANGDEVIHNKEAMSKDYLEENIFECEGKHNLDAEIFVEQIKKIVDEKMSEE